MPRRPRVATGGYVYHALNRAVGRSTIFEQVDDYAAFEEVLEEARDQVDMRLLAFCAMPNHTWCCGLAKTGTYRTTWGGWPTPIHGAGI
jgi:REP element-mobilizing transposase RayT